MSASMLCCYVILLFMYAFGISIGSWSPVLIMSDPPLPENVRTVHACQNETFWIRCTFSGEAMENARADGYTISRNGAVFITSNQPYIESNVRFQATAYAASARERPVVYKCTLKFLSLSSRLELDPFDCANEQVNDYRKMEGQNVTLNCIHAGYDDDEVFWYLDGYPLAESNRQLKLTNLSQQDSGVYRCFVTGQSRSSVYRPRVRGVTIYNLTVLPDTAAPNLNISNVTDTTANLEWNTELEQVNRFNKRRRVNVSGAVTVCLLRLTSFRITPEKSKRHDVSAGNSTRLTNLEPGSFYIFYITRSNAGHVCFKNGLIPTRSFHFLNTLKAPSSQYADVNMPRMFARRPRRFDKMVIGKLGEPLLLFCGADLSNDQSVKSVAWHRESDVNTTQDEIHTRLVNSSGAFKIDTLLYWDTGLYTCRVTFHEGSPFGQTFVQAILVATTQNPNTREDDYLNLKCPNSTESSLLVKWAWPRPRAEIPDAKIRYYNRVKHYENPRQITVSKTTKQVLLENLKPESVYAIEFEYTDFGHVTVIRKYCLTGTTSNR